MTADPLQDLSAIFLRFPGIGRRQARRFVYYLLGRPANEINWLITALRSLQTRSGECRSCHRFYLRQDQLDYCPLCRDTSRDQSQLLVVEKDADLDNLEKAGVYRGYYFVLVAGEFNPEEPTRGLRLTALTARLKNEPRIKEVIVALSANADGDQQANLVKTAIEQLTRPDLRISLLGRGLSSGAELEYADPETLKNALLGRHS